MTFDTWYEAGAYFAPVEIEQCLECDCWSASTEEDTEGEIDPSGFCRACVRKSALEYAEIFRAAAGRERGEQERPESETRAA